MTAKSNVGRLGVGQWEPPQRRARQQRWARWTRPAFPGSTVGLGIRRFRASEEAAEKHRKEHADKEDCEKRETDDVETADVSLSGHGDRLPRKRFGNQPHRSVVHEFTGR